jgi:hypothetical protein
MDKTRVNSSKIIASKDARRGGKRRRRRVKGKGEEGIADFTTSFLTAIVSKENLFKRIENGAKYHNRYFGVVQP